MKQGDGYANQMEECVDGGEIRRDGVQHVRGGGVLVEGVAKFNYLGRPWTKRMMIGRQ